ncbi:ferritin [Entomoplasma freundtii]|uniref:Ferritin n=1 Tax=Entomoplasma freundtii TaxID=74700 RepID=A0A2K8NRZ1_9MOLU|nr:ferritin-like domain-containing protein [Entomoplasma freundtii]ATZ16615.1 ferritin [Entomoplasma freundtii]TDY58218.1 ferritin [Entomoplasma freundtii]
MIKKELVNDITSFLNLHILTQMNCMQLSKELAQNGYPGFAWFYQVQAEDEFMHQRRIINFLQGTEGAGDYILEAPQFKPFKIDNPAEAIQYYIKMRQDTLAKVTKLKDNAYKAGDYLVSDFYNWFIKDYWTEISENQDVLDRVKMNPESLAGLDRRMGKRGEIEPDHVIHPMKIFIAD